MTETIIQELCAKEAVRWTAHVVKRFLQRGIAQDDVLHALSQGEIIEQYPEDYPYPSCLVLGISLQRDFLHVVCGSNQQELWIITAYYPSSAIWNAGFRTRREVL
jgi:hypothetical protein